MKILTFDQGTPEWFAARLGKPTGSTYAEVLSKGKGDAESAGRRNLRVKLALELITGERDEGGFKSQAMKDGTEREPLARALYESSVGCFVDEIGFCLHDTIHTGVSPDGLIDAEGMVEIKCPTPATHLEYLRRKDEPPEYRAQIQGQLWIAERTWCDFVSYHPSFPANARMVVRRVLRDDAYIAKLEAEIIKFNAEVQAEADAIRHYQQAA